MVQVRLRRKAVTILRGGLSHVYSQFRRVAIYPKGCMMKRLIVGLAVALVTVASGQARGDTIWDYSPGTTGATIEPTLGNWSNTATVQNWGEQIQFATDVQITGMDIYSHILWGSLGDSATIRLWADSGRDRHRARFEVHRVQDRSGTRPHSPGALGRAE